jgi:hypothetical protein
MKTFLEYLEEVRLVIGKSSGKINFPKYNQVVILAGGAGSVTQNFTVQIYCVVL